MESIAVMVEQQPTLLDGHPVMADVVRLFIILVGFTLFLIAAKVSIGAVRDRDVEKAAGLVAFGLFAVTPSINGLFRFNEPLQAFSTVIYCLGLLAGVVATLARITIRWRWLRSRRTPAASGR